MANVPLVSQNLVIPNTGGITLAVKNVGTAGASDYTITNMCAAENQTGCVSDGTVSGNQ
jgi:hypothetical protein